MTDGFRYEEAKAFVLSRGHPNCMEIKRHLQVGYNEAAEYMDRMEREGIVSAPNNMGQRLVLASVDRRVATVKQGAMRSTRARSRRETPQSHDHPPNSGGTG